MIVAGWGKGSKKLAYLGIAKCGNCKNWVHFNLFEVANKVSVYFVPVAKFNKKYYMVCGVCNAAIEISAEQKDEALKASLALPGSDTVQVIWDGLGDAFKTAAAAADPGKAIDDAIDDLKTIYPGDHVDYVTQTYVKWLKDEDRPK